MADVLESGSVLEVMGHHGMLRRCVRCSWRRTADVFLILVAGSCVLAHEVLGTLVLVCAAILWELVTILVPICWQSAYILIPSDGLIDITR